MGLSSDQLSLSQRRSRFRLVLSCFSERPKSLSLSLFATRKRLCRGENVAKVGGARDVRGRDDLLEASARGLAQLVTEDQRRLRRARGRRSKPSGGGGFPERPRALASRALETQRVQHRARQTLEPVRVGAARRRKAARREHLATPNGRITRNESFVCVKVAFSLSLSLSLSLSAPSFALHQPHPPIFVSTWLKARECVRSGPIELCFFSHSVYT